MNPEIELEENKQSEYDFTLSPYRVWYGWESLSKIRKRKGMVILFENSTANYERKMRHVNRIKPVHMRYQTVKEAEGVIGTYREFTQYRLFLDDKAFKGDLEKLLETNSEADKYHVSEKEREEIKTKLRRAFTNFY